MALSFLLIIGFFAALGFGIVYILRRRRINRERERANGDRD